MKEEIRSALDSDNKQAIDSLRAKLYQEYERQNPPPATQALSEEWVIWERNRMRYVEDKWQQEQYGASDHSIPKGHVYKKHE